MMRCTGRDQAAIGGLANFLLGRDKDMMQAKRHGVAVQNQAGPLQHRQIKPNAVQKLRRGHTCGQNGVICAQRPDCACNPADPPADLDQAFGRKPRQHPRARGCKQRMGQGCGIGGTFGDKVQRARGRMRKRGFQGSDLFGCHRIGRIAQSGQIGLHLIKALALILPPQRTLPARRGQRHLALQAVMRAHRLGAQAVVGGINIKAGVDPAKTAARGSACGARGLDHRDLAPRPRQAKRKACPQQTRTDDKDFHGFSLYSDADILAQDAKGGRDGR